MSAIQEIVRFQTDRGLDKQEYNALNEHGNIVEELLESEGLDVDKVDRPNLKKSWTRFIATVKSAGITKQVSVFDFAKAKVVDAYCDIIVFCVGAILKLGYDPERALLETAKEINSRVGTMVDGKFEKDLSEEAKANWYEADYDGQAKL